MNNIKLVAKDCSRVYTPTQRGGTVQNFSSVYIPI